MRGIQCKQVCVGICIATSEDSLRCGMKALGEFWSHVSKFCIVICVNSSCREKEALVSSLSCNRRFCIAFMEAVLL